MAEEKGANVETEKVEAKVTITLAVDMDELHAFLEEWQTTSDQLRGLARIESAEVVLPDGVKTIPLGRW